MRSYVVYICSGGCGYSERARVWDSAPLGRDSILRCPECGMQAWEDRYLTKDEATSRQERGYYG